MSVLNLKFTLESFYRSNESQALKEITSSFVSVTLEIAAQLMMKDYRSKIIQCQKSFKELGKAIRLSASTVKRELNKAVRLGIFEKVGLTKNGLVKIRAGQWFNERVQQGKAIAKRNIEKCGTVYKPVHKYTPPVHSELPKETLLKLKETIKLKGKQGNFLNTRGKKKMYDDEISTQGDESAFTEKQTKGCMKGLTKPLKDLIITHDHKLAKRDNKKENLRALKMLAEKLGMSGEIKHNMYEV